MLEVEGVSWLRHVVRTLVVLTRDDAARPPFSAVTGVASTPTVLVVLVARDLAKLRLAVGESAVGSVWAALIHLVEFAFNSFEIVPKALPVLSLSALVPILVTVTATVASFIRLSLMGSVTAVMLVAIALVTGRHLVEGLVLLRRRLLVHVVVWLRECLVLHLGLRSV